MYDVFFLSHDEPIADSNWRILQHYVPSARRIQGIHGIVAAHRACAESARTSHFFVVDADNEVVDGDFDFRVPTWDREYVHLWYAKNPVNGLEYGWGGVKLFPRRLVLEMSQDRLDMTTSFALKVISTIKSKSHFNYEPFGTWRSAFRETTKLSQHDDDESRSRLKTWCEVARGMNAAYCLAGARAGKAFGLAHAGDLERLKIINDYSALRDLFEADYEEITRQGTNQTWVDGFQ